MQTREGATSYYAQDALGSTRALTDAGGNFTDGYSYSAFGELFAQTGSTTNTYLYAGQQHDAATGLYSMRARYYDPSVGRFLTRDTFPINYGNPIELNRYAYAANNSTNLTDPSGCSPFVGYGTISQDRHKQIRQFAGALSGFMGSAYMVIAAQLGICGGNQQPWALDLAKAFDFIARSTAVGYLMGSLDSRSLVMGATLLSSAATVFSALQALQGGDLGTVLCIAIGYFGARNPLLLPSILFPLPAPPTPPQLPPGGPTGPVPIGPGPIVPIVPGPIVPVPPQLPPGGSGGNWGGGGGCYNSFSADTPVATEEGAVPISQIEIGDQVLAYNEQTGEVAEYTVTDTISHLDRVIVHVTIDGELLETTPEHPFYTIEEEWVEAEDLEVDDQIRNLDGKYGEVEAVVTLSVFQRMYNLTVDEAHTFFVGDGDWLVHNCGLDEKYSNVPSRQQELFPDVNRSAGAGLSNPGRLVEVPGYGLDWNWRQAPKSDIDTLAIFDARGQGDVILRSASGPLVRNYQSTL